MNIILIGAPGTGKGTQAQFISNYYNIPIISTGDLLKNASSKNNDFQINHTINKGKLINNDIVIQLIQEQLVSLNCKNGVILDGFPRTLHQAYYLEQKKIKIDYIFYFWIPEHKIIERITGRQIHLQSGRIYHSLLNPPKKPGLDDITGEPLTIRLDDNQKIIGKRIKQYNLLTYPIIKYYQTNIYYKNTKYYIINSSQSIKEIQKKIIEIIK